MLMKSKLLLLVFAANLFVLPLFSQQLSLVVHFDKDQFTLDDEATKNLELWVTQNQELKNEAIYLRGHTDSDAENAYNIALSKKRNMSVRNFLEQHSFSKVEAEYFGEDWPLNDNQDESKMAMNRRVEICAPSLATIREKGTSVSDLPQIFFVDGDEDCSIRGAEGTVLFLPKNSLVTKRGNPFTGRARVELREFYSLESCILNNISTQSNGEILETAGMVYVEAFDGETALNVNPTTPMKIQFAFEQELGEDFHIFLGAFVDKLNPNGKKMSPFAKNYTSKISPDISVNWSDSLELAIDRDWPEGFDPTFGHQIRKPQPSSGVREYGIDFTAEELKKREELMAGPDSKKIARSKRLTTDQKAMYPSYLIQDRTAFDVPAFGWINCDRYLPTQNLLVNMPVKSTYGNDAVYYLVFERERSILRPLENNYGQLVFYNVPVGTKATLLGLYKEGGKTYFASESFLISSELRSLQFEVSSKSDIQSLIVELDEAQKKTS